MKELFGTDGIRGRANEYPMTPEMAVRIGRAAAFHFCRQRELRNIVIGRDTRISGDMLVNAISAGICAMGVDVRHAGVITTPGVAFLTSSLQAAAGIVVSASHNPYHDNGIKFFCADGRKPTDAVEMEIERLLHEGAGLEREGPLTPFTEPGQCRPIQDGARRYRDFLKSTVSDNRLLAGLKIVLDCANGASHQIAPQVFSDLGADLEVLFASPNGQNINHNCGSEYPAVLARKVRQLKADLGFAFDGDGDRVLAVDHRGTPLTGDQAMLICTRHLKATQRLQNNLLVTTVMSNMGLGKALRDYGIGHIATAVGDRHVLEGMYANGAVIGGGDSGHMIFLEHHCTGDGLLAALQLVEAMRFYGVPLAEMSLWMPVFPQVLINVPVVKKPPVETLEQVQSVIRDMEKRLGEDGRVLVRYSGTQHVCRVMVEGPSDSETRQCCEAIAGAVAAALGHPGA